jgi:pimeloyl-ACP methyl ester carboxylesterase
MIALDSYLFWSPAMTKLYAALSLILSTTAIGGSSEQFSLLSQDGLATLSGQIDFPEGNTLPLVVMVPGTGLFDRDVDFAAPGSENGLIFKALSQELNRLGFAVLRHDYRGVKCSLSNAPACPSCKTPQERRDHFIRSCLDNSIRATVTPENIRDDIHSIYELGKNHKRIDPSRITVFGHSEGSLHLSHLIKDERIQPKAALFMGGLAESPSSVVRWQMIGRFIDAFLGMDSDRDGTISNDEIKRGHASSRLNNFPLEYLLSTTGGWDQESLLYWRQKE